MARFWMRLSAMWNTHEKLRFLVVGIYNTLFGYGTFAVLYLLLHQRVHYLIIMVMSHIFAVCNAFIGHRLLVFRVEGSFWLDFLRFNLSYLGLLVFNLAAMPLLVEGLAIHPLIGSALLVAVTTATSFLLHKRISFRRTGRV